MLEKTNRTFLVTGGDGFIGRHLAKRLAEDGDNVIVLDNHITSHPSEPTDRVQILELDVETVEPSLFGELDGIFHMASIAAPRLFIEHPMAVIKPNVHGTERMVNLAEQFSCRLIFTSSSETYGSGGTLTSSNKMDENHISKHQLLSQKSPYSTSKLLGEELIREARQRGIDASAVRLFNVYGGGMDPTLQGRGRVIPNILNALQAGLPVPIEGDGSQSRTFTWIEDVIEGLVQLMRLGDSPPLVLNMGSETPITILELAHSMADAIGVKPQFEYTERLSGDPDWRCPDCSLLRSTIGWSPQTSLQDGIRRLIEGTDLISFEPIPIGE